MIEICYSEEHLIFPKIIIAILIVLLIAIIITEGIKRIKNGGNFFTLPERFFVKNTDHLKFFGTIALSIAYVFFMKLLGFTLVSMIFVFLFNTLYTSLNKKNLRASIIISIIFPIVISIIFGVVFRITLPSGLFSVTFADYGFTIY